MSKKFKQNIRITIQRNDDGNAHEDTYKHNEHHNTSQQPLSNPRPPPPTQTHTKHTPQQNPMHPISKIALNHRNPESTSNSHIPETKNPPKLRRFSSKSSPTKLHSPQITLCPKSLSLRSSSSSDAFRGRQWRRMPHSQEREEGARVQIPGRFHSSAEGPCTRSLCLARGWRGGC